jgi:outer membrane lipoprotein carrier protein
MSIRLIALCALLLSVAGQPVWAADGATQLKNFLSGLDTLQAEFNQTILPAGEDTVYATSGVFYLQRPGKLRWEYEDPATQIIVADGKRIWLHDIELEQVSHRSQRAALEGTPAQLLSSTAPLDESFEMHEEGVVEEVTWLELLPKEKDAQFAKVRLGFKKNELLQMEMFDSFGQVTRFFFFNMTRNPALSSELFVFIPPPQIDLIGDL